MAEALKTAKLLGIPDANADPAEVLIREIRDQSGTVLALRELLNDLDADSVLSGPGAGVASMHAERQQRLMNICAVAVKLQIDSRSQQLVAVVSAFRGDVLRALTQVSSLTTDQRTELQSVVMAEMRRLEPALALESPK